MFNVARILILLLYTVRCDILNPHAVPLPDEEPLIRDPIGPKRGYIPRLLSDSSISSEEEETKSDNLILYYSFNGQNPGSSKIRDESGFDNNGVVEIGGMLLEIPGSSCGVAAYLWDQSIKTIFSTPDGVPKYGFSISMWIKMLILEGQRIVFQVRGRRYGMMSIKFVDKVAHFSYKQCFNCTVYFYLVAETEITRNWFHLAATYNATNGIAQFYINGVALNRTWNKNFEPFQFWGNDVRIGGFQGHTSLRGFVDDVRMYNYALSAPEVYLLSQSCCFLNCKPHPQQPIAIGTKRKTESTRRELPRSKKTEIKTPKKPAH